MVLWSLGKSSLSLPHFKAADFFAVHILSRDQEFLSGQFARRGVDKFAGVEIDRGPDQIPLLKDCAARFVCKSAYQYEGGDHIIFVGEVTEFTHWNREPLLFHGGQYGQIIKNQMTIEEPGEDDFTETPLGYLLRVSMHQILRPLKSELTKRGLSITQYFVLGVLAMYNHKTREQLFGLLEQGDSVPPREEFEDLFDRGLIQDVNGEMQLTAAGSKLHVVLAAFYKDSESVALKQLDYEMRQTLKISLMRLIESTHS